MLFADFVAVLAVPDDNGGHLRRNLLFTAAVLSVSGLGLTLANSAYARMTPDQAAAEGFVQPTQFPMIAPSNEHWARASNWLLIPNTSGSRPASNDEGLEEQH